MTSEVPAPRRTRNGRSGRSPVGATWQIVVILSIILFSSGLYYGLNRQENSPRRTSLKKLAASTSGFIWRRFVDDNGLAYRYVVYAPSEIKPTERLPLLVHLNGHGENGNDGTRPLYNGLAKAIWERQSDFPFVVFWPQCEQGTNWDREAGAAKRVISMIKEVEKEFHTDPDRVFLTGISSGGVGTWSIAGQFPDVFAAIIPVSAPDSAGSVGPVADAKLPVWIYTVRDDIVPATSGRVDTQNLLERGLSPCLSELNSGGHDAWSFAFRDEGLYRWLARQRRSENRLDLPFSLADRASYPATIDLIGSRDSMSTAGTSSRKQDTGSDQPVNPFLTAIAVDGLSDLHIEFRPTPGVTRFCLGFFSRDSNGQTHGRTLDFPIEDLNCGGLYSWPHTQCIVPSSPIADRSVRTNSWNDLRIQLSHGRLAVQLNGWSFLENVPGTNLSQDSVIGFCAWGEPGESVQLQRLRFRKTAAGKLNRHVDPTGPNKAESPATDVNKEIADRPSPIDIESLIAIWTRREQSLSSVQLSWNRDKESRFASHHIRQHDAAPRPAESRLILSNQNMSYSTLWPHTSLLDLWRSSDAPCLSSQSEYDASFAKLFRRTSHFPPGSLRLGIRIVGDLRTEVASLLDGTRHYAIETKKDERSRQLIGDLDEISWQAGLLSLRPLSTSGLQRQKSQFRVLETMACVAGVQCNVVEQQVATDRKELRRLYWIDAERDCSVRRAAVWIDGIFREQVDLEYLQDLDKGWLPSGWTLLSKPRMPAPTVAEGFPGEEWCYYVSSAKVVATQFDESADDWQANSDFPPGTIIFDQINQEWFQQTAEGQRKRLGADEAKLYSFPNAQATK